MRIRVPKTRLVLSGRRLAVLGAVWVALGAAMNVGVALVGPPPLSPTVEPDEPWLAQWPIAVPASWPEAPDDGAVKMRQYFKDMGQERAYQAFLVWSHRPVHLGADGDVRSYTVTGFRSGWPAHAFTAYTAFETTASPNARPTPVAIPLPLLQRGIPLGRDPLTSYSVPLCIRWRGFFLNMLLYVPLAAVVSVYGVVWPATVVRQTWRRRREGRRWRGDRCIGCGYDLSGLVPGQPCPECGREKPWPDLEGHLADE